MASGKKQYLISSTAYGITFNERYNRFDLAQRESKAHQNAHKFDSPPNRGSILSFYEKYLMRTDGLLQDEEYPAVNAPVDPIRAYSNRLWSVKGRSDTKEMIYLSGAMKQDAGGEAYNSLPFDIVFSDDVTKTGDGILPTGVENQMLNWRNSKISKDVSSGLFPVYKENLKLLPVADTFKQYYLKFTGQTSEDLLMYDDQARDPAVAEKLHREMLGSAYQNYGATYMWNLMRLSILGNARAVKNRAGAAYEDYSTYINIPFSKLETSALAHTGKSSHFIMNSEYNFYSQLYEDYSAMVPETFLPCLALQQAAETTQGDPQVVYLANDNITLGGALGMSSAEKLTTRPSAKEEAHQKKSELSSKYWSKYGGTLAQISRHAFQHSTGRTIKPRTDNFNYETLARVANQESVMRSVMENFPAAIATMAQIKNLCFSGDYGSIISDPESMRENYPMYAEISFAADHFAQFSDAVNDAGLMTDLMDSLIASQPENRGSINDIAGRYRPPRSIHKAVWESAPKLKVTPKLAGGASGCDMTVSSTVSILPKRRQVLDVETWLSKVLNNEINTTNMTGRLHAHSNGLAGPGAANPLEKQIKSIIAYGKIKDLIADNTRRYSQVLNGEHAYSETVVYQVKKSLANISTTGERSPGQFIQNFWFANSTDITNISFMDTQVHYGKEYLYEIFAYTLIIGTKYDIGNQSVHMSSDFKSYDDLSRAVSANDPMLKLMSPEDANLSQAVWYIPSPKIVKTRIAAQSVLMYDSAPIAPEIEFVPYKGNNHMLLLVLKGNVGRQQLPSITINSSLAEYGRDRKRTEAAALREQRQAQQWELLPCEDLLYESDDRPDYFEVYRTTKAPYSYSDFDGHMLAKVGTRIPSSKTTYPHNLILPKYADSATMKDIIVPNRKYYYTVRQVDVHGNFSNPTPVFEVEMVDQQGMIYPIIKEYIFKDPIPKTHRKYFNKHIKIAPSPQQVLINTENMTSAHDAANGAVQLGVAETNIWGKQYKVRITSTTTGKSADLNINFNQEHKRSLAEMDGSPNTDAETGVTEGKLELAGPITGQKH